MLETSNASLHSVSVHVAGNKSNKEELILSEKTLPVGEDKLRDLLLTYFLSGFNAPEFFAFHYSNGEFTLNPLFRFASEIFSDPGCFHENSREIARHLYEVTQHPNIKSGDLYIAYISGINLENKQVDCLGIFKAENKENYLKLDYSHRDFTVIADRGINVNKLDKGCLILNAFEDSGFKICIVDNTNKAEAQFWKNDFLNVKPWSDAFHHTQNFLHLTRQYLVDELQEEFNVPKTDQIDLMNRSVNFFKSRDQFDQREFETEVLADANVIESFRRFEKDYNQKYPGDIIDNFEISAQAVKRQARIFKSVLKLDKNFHIYIHGNRELIERGFDEVIGKHYYKVYFDKEN
jgi:hypothetical protein